MKSWPETWRIRVAVFASPRVFLYHPRDLLSLVQWSRYAHHVPSRKERGREGWSISKKNGLLPPTGQRLASWPLQNRGRNEHRMGIIGHRSERLCRHYMEERRRKLSVAAVLVLHYEKVDPRYRARKMTCTWFGEVCSCCS